MNILNFVITNVFLLGIILPAGSPVTAAQESQCKIEPPQHSFVFPERGVVWKEGEDLEGPCYTVPPAKWERRRSKTFDLMVYADGPSGSGRFWNVTVVMAQKGQTKATRGFCITTSTLGWRTMQRFKALRWIDDADRDGNPEFILWSSFDLGDDPLGSESGLVAWVYEFDPKGELLLDRGLTGVIALELAEAYRKPPGRNNVGLKAQRLKAARELEALAKGACSRVFGLSAGPGMQQGRVPIENSPLIGIDWTQFATQLLLPRPGSYV